MKKAIYIALFTLFGVLLQFFVHAMVEICYIRALTVNFPQWSLGFSWTQWFTIHTIVTVVMLAAGAGLGLWGGFFFWQKIYVEKRYGAKNFFKRG